MSLEVAYHPLAVAEIVNAEDWYERQNQGLGDRFLAAIDDAVRRTSRWPQSGTPVASSDDGVVLNRKVSVGGFPWAVGDEVVDETLLVLAVFHQRRRPDYWTIRSR